MPKLSGNWIFFLFILFILSVFGGMIAAISATRDRYPTVCTHLISKQVYRGHAVTDQGKLWRYELVDPSTGFEVWIKPEEARRDWQCITET